MADGPINEQSAMHLVSTGTAEHYSWGDNCDGWFLLKAENVHVIQERMPPSANEVMHYHRKSRQLFYVLSGELTMQIHAESVTIPAGHALVIDPPAPHQARNQSGEPVEFLVISAPPSHDDRFNCE